MSEKPNLPESCIGHQSKYQSDVWRQYTLAELGQWVHLLVKRCYHRSDVVRRAKDLHDAQNYLNMMQAHIDAAVVTERNEILERLSWKTVEAPEPKLEHESGATKTLKEILVELPMEETTELPVEQEPEPEGPPRDAQGNVTRVSTQPGDSGYDPEAGENLGLQILCGGVHIPTAHTADTVMGVVWYYEKNGQGRIKTKELHGKVEIRGLK